MEEYTWICGRGCSNTILGPDDYDRILFKYRIDHYYLMSGNPKHYFWKIKAS